MQIMRHKKKFTVMFVPHNGSAIKSIEFSAIFLIGMLVLFVGLAFGTIFFSYKLMFTSTELKENIEYLTESESALQSLSEDLKRMSGVGTQFTAELEKTSNLLGHNTPSAASSGIVGDGDLSQALQVSQNKYPQASEIVTLLSVKEQLDRNLPLLKNINGVLNMQKQILSDLPVYWPVPTAHVSAEWGPNIHPIYGSWYIHKGIDLAAAPGTPILAVANGIVTSVNFEANGHGLNVYISHKYGFKTHYSHMSAINVVKGQKITQGQRIGALGSTGLVTGPHLHLELYLGNELVDPGQYLRTLHSYERPVGNR